ncbi:amidohydrolase [Amycolatopsis taiwanensis]|uniref:Amidohydrolase n=2 Tax=Amycolatopsis taiwanensis TaxID=342230 RepID=A0A9W6R7W6_9PSEU|nr:amidohydrolase [Amycolatopsis taiwanensis]
MADMVLRADRVLPDADAGIIADGAVAVRNAEIVAVGRFAELPPELTSTARVVEFGDATLLPGLVDCHVHLAMDGSAAATSSELTATDAELACRMVNSARRLLDAGVTTARDLGCRGEVAATVRDAVRDGLVPGPRLLVANAPITVTGGHAWRMGGEADGALEVAREVRIRAKQRSDVVKIMSTGGFMTAGSRPWEARYTEEELRACVEEAHRLGMPVTTHALGVEGIRRAVEAGVDMIEHCGWVTEQGTRFDPEIAAKIASAGIVVCPTMNTACLPDPYFCPWGERDSLIDNLRGMRAAGVELVAGTDAGIGLVPFENYADGLDVLADAGMSPREIIAAATHRAAAAIGLGAVTGRLATGLAADVVAVEGDPTEDVAALHRPVQALSAGRAHDCAKPSEADRAGQRVAARAIHDRLTIESGRNR